MNKHKWCLFLPLGLALLLASSLVACASAPESPVSTTPNNEVAPYLAETDAILNETTRISLEAAGIQKVADQLDESEITKVFTDYDKDYDDLLARFAQLECPPECEKLRQHVLSGINYLKQQVAELGVAYKTGGSLDKAKGYYDKAQNELMIVAREQDKLSGR